MSVCSPTVAVCWSSGKNRLARIEEDCNLGVSSHLEMFQYKGEGLPQMWTERVQSDDFGLISFEPRCSLFAVWTDKDQVTRINSLDICCLSKDCVSEWKPDLAPLHLVVPPPHLRSIVQKRSVNTKQGKENMQISPDCLKQSQAVQRESNHDPIHRSKQCTCAAWHQIKPTLLINCKHFFNGWCKIAF